ncbi:cell surface glycoprotein 1-like [Drosophila biarmipes]|uniref:cell surface glycoprotein 1-like n=1 Tax=Drosophila biarmipes TaxID=125945 RepID=UPI0021CC9F93|nr:cell surface glycoprotein 1-like [Drosophila biarmipes]
MSTRVARSDAKKAMSARQPAERSCPGQGGSTTRPTRTSRLISRRGKPDPVISSDSDVELVEDPRLEQRRWRLQKATSDTDGRIPTGTTHVEWACEEPPAEQRTPRSHEEQVAAATLEFRLSLEARRKTEEAQLREMEEDPDWQARLRRAEEEEQQLWEEPKCPPTPRYVAEPWVPPQEVADVRAASSPGWLPEVPLTPRYEGSPTRPPSPRGEALPARSPSPPQPDTPPSPARHGGESPQWKPARPPTPRFERPPAVGSHPRPDTPQCQPGDPVGHHVRTDIPAAHVTHSVRSFVAEGVRWRQQTVVWTWPEGPAEKTTVEEPRIWEETGPRVSPMDPRTRGRPDLWTPPTPSTRPSTPGTGPTTTAATRDEAEAAEPQERGPWKWPEPTGGGRPSFKRQHSAPVEPASAARPKYARLAIWAAGAACGSGVADARIA